MEDEFICRKTQAKSLAVQMMKNQLSHYEALILYKMIWIPQISYCLPIVTFNHKECQEIHRPILNAFLTKSGYNRHMPRAVVHGVS